MIRVLVADDHAIVRKGIKQILSEVPEIAVVGEAKNGQQVLDQVRDDTYDVAQNTALSVSAAQGVLSNDRNPFGGPLSAVEVQAPTPQVVG